MAVRIRNKSLGGGNGTHDGSGRRDGIHDDSHTPVTSLLRAGNKKSAAKIEREHLIDDVVRQKPSKEVA